MAGDPMAELQAKYQQLVQLQAEMVELMASLPQPAIGDYRLKTHDGGEVGLEDLFGDQDALILVHNMGFSCDYCTMWTDGFNGVLPHLQERAAFVVASPDPIAAQAKGKAKRGWTFPMVSAEGTTLFADMGFEHDGQPMPGASIFVKDADGKISRRTSTMFGPGDKFCSVWAFAELLPGGMEAAQ
ncbi:MAG: DUF899 family protein [Alphaproteobacteria bacterium]